MNPEKKIEGSMIVMLICNASFWLSAFVDTSKPRLTSANTYSNAAAKSMTRLPWIGTKNTQRRIVKRNSAITIAMHRYGTSLPSIKPQRVIGLTSRFSYVPRSRSRTMDMAAAKTVAICSAVPITPGTKKFGARIDGL